MGLVESILKIIRIDWYIYTVTLKVATWNFVIFPEKSIFCDFFWVAASRKYSDNFNLSLNYNDLVFEHVHPWKPYQICSSGSKGELLTHNISSHIEFLNCWPTFWVRPPLKKKWNFSIWCMLSHEHVTIIMDTHAYNQITNRNISWRFEVGWN